MPRDSLFVTGAQALLLIIPLVLSLTVHEFAHAWSAMKLGDSTAKDRGRLTLNPISHIDPVGSVALPWFLLVMQGVSGMTGLPLLGWAKPTPLTPSRLTKRLSTRQAEMLVALSGPLSNLLLAALSALAFGFYRHLSGELAWNTPPVALAIQLVFLNVGLAIFNLLPIGPLDGHKVLCGLLPMRQAIAFERFNAQLGSLLLWGIVLFGRPLLGVPIRFVAVHLLTMLRL